MIEDSTEEFLTTSSGEGSFGLPSPRKHDMRASLTPVTTTPWLKGILHIVATQQEESSHQHQTKASVSSHWDIS
jgi:hypothetical protein